ncbi:hypothetical protein [Epilithonimonas hominis]|nr:hypothetical protein [Epilithonimonas hominis]
MKKVYPTRTKTARITLRLLQELKNQWQSHCNKSNIYLPVVHLAQINF